MANRFHYTFCHFDITVIILWPFRRIERINDFILHRGRCLTDLVIIIYVASCRSVSIDLPGPLSPPVSIVHCSREVFQATSCIGTELLYISSSGSSNLCSSQHTCYNVEVVCVSIWLADFYFRVFLYSFVLNPIKFFDNSKCRLTQI